VIESVSSFYASALNEVIVFGAISPIVLLPWPAAGSATPSAEVEEA